MLLVYHRLLQTLEFHLLLINIMRTHMKIEYRNEVKGILTHVFGCVHIKDSNEC